MAGTSLCRATSRMGSSAGRWASYRPSAAPLPSQRGPWHVGDPARDTGSRGHGRQDPSRGRAGGRVAGGRQAPEGRLRRPWSLRHSPVPVLARPRLALTCRWLFVHFPVRLKSRCVPAASSPGWHPNRGHTTPLPAEPKPDPPVPGSRTFPSPCMATRGMSPPRRADQGPGPPHTGARAQWHIGAEPRELRTPAAARTGPHA